LQNCEINPQVRGTEFLGTTPGAQTIQAVPLPKHNGHASLALTKLVNSAALVPISKASERVELNAPH